MSLDRIENTINKFFSDTKPIGEDEKIALSEILNQLSMLVAEKNNNKAIQYAEQAYELSRSGDCTDTEIHSLANLGRYHSLNQDFTKALHYYNRCAEMHDVLDHKQELAEVMNKIGLIYLNLEDYRLSVEYYRRSIIIYKELKDAREEARVNGQLGNIYQTVGMMEEALEHFFKALQLYRRSGMNTGVVSILTRIGNLQFRSGRLDSALKNFRRAHRIALGLEDTLFAANTLYHIGTVQAQLRMLRQASASLRRAMEIFRERHHTAGIVLCLNLFARMRESGGKTRLATRYWTEALQVSQKNHYYQGMVSGRISLGRNLYETGDISGAKTHLDIAVELSEKVKDRDRLKEALEILYKIQHLSGDHAAAFETFRRFHQEKDFLIDSLVHKQMQLMRVQKDLLVSSKESELNHTRAELVIQEEILAGQKKELNRKESHLTTAYDQMQDIQNALEDKNAIIEYINHELEERNRELIEANRLVQQKNMELTEAYKQLEILATIDPLTQIPNRRYFLDEIEKERNRFERSQRPFSIVLGDIDNFKQVNDQYGHDCGDYVLKSVSAIIRNMLRSQDTPARWGGEEFIILLPETALDGGVLLAEKIRKKVEETAFSYEGTDLRVTITFGTSQIDDTLSILRCIKRADLALYEGKRRTKNCVIAENQLQTVTG